MATKLRFGILSTGNIARQFATGIRASTRCTLQAVGSRSLESAQAFAQAQQVKTPYGSYDQLLADTDVDAVYNALPNSLHHEWTIKALRAGKHVLCEKPFAVNLTQAKEMIVVAKETGKVLAEAFMYRSHPQTLKILETIRSGTIGQVRLIRASFNYKTNRIADNIRFKADLAGGALMDIGCYCLDFCQLIAQSQPAEYAAFGQIYPSGIDELAVGTLRFPNNIVATFSCGMTVAADNTAMICGTDGYILIPVPWKPPIGNAQFTIAYGIPPQMDRDPSAKANGPKVIKVDADRDLYSYEADDFAATVLDGQPQRMPHESTLSNMRILDEMRKQLGVKL